MSDQTNTGANDAITVKDTAVKYGVTTENDYTMARKAHEGVKASAFFDLISISGLTHQELASLLDLSFKTVQRYQKENKKFNALNSEQLLKLVALYHNAEEVFGEIASFDRWLRKPSAGLGNTIPFTFLQTPGGMDLIRDELYKIEFGAFA